MDQDRCYIYVQGLKANPAFKDSARAAAAAAPMRACVILGSAAQWPNHAPTPSASDCATVICGCEGHPHQFVHGTANDYRIRKAFLAVEAKC